MKMQQKNIAYTTQNFMVIDLLALIGNKIMLLDDLYKVVRGDIWNERKKQNYIESILLGLPLNPLFVDGASFYEPINHYAWVIVDGYNRLKTLQEFCESKSFKLTNNQSFDDLPAWQQRQLHTQEITVHILSAGTSLEERYRFFDYINPINIQKRRHIINYGKPHNTILELKELFESYYIENRRYIQINNIAELMLKYIAFVCIPNYETTELFLNSAMNKISQLDELKIENCKKKLEQKLQNFSYDLFFTFSKQRNSFSSTQFLHYLCQDIECQNDINKLLKVNKK